jgi:hypothetical protein
VTWFSWSKEVAPVLANHIPQDPAEAVNWLPAVFYAARCCDERFGVWVARQTQLVKGARLDRRLLFPLALYAWHSLQAENPLRSITVTAWSPDFSLNRAIDEAEAWLARLTILAHCGNYPIEDVWLSGGRIGDFHIVPIVTWDALMTERLAMRNCLHTYVDRLACGGCRLFAVKRGARSVAALEVTADHRGGLSLGQLRGLGNAAPSPEVKAAVRSWFAKQAKETLVMPRRRVDSAQAASRLSELMAPYRSMIDGGAELLTLSSLKDLTARLRERLVEVRPARRMAPEAQRFGADRDHGLSAQLAGADRVRTLLRARLGEDLYAAWFQMLEFDELDAGTLRVSVPVRFLRNWIRSHYMDDLIWCCATVWPDVAEVHVMLRAPGRVLMEDPVASADRGEPAEARAQPRPANIHGILIAVSRRYAVPRFDLLSQRRHRSVALPRQIGMYLAYRGASRGVAEIGRGFGDRDPTAVRYAIRKIEERINTDPAFAREIEELRFELFGHPPT